MPADVRDVFVVSADITAEEHVRMQAAMQALWITACPRPSTSRPAPPGRCRHAYLWPGNWAARASPCTSPARARKSCWKPMRPPIRRNLINELAVQLDLWQDSKKPRPRSLHGFTYSIETPLGKAFITINENGGNQPFEVFINTAKAGSDTAAVSEAIGRLISYILRLASPIEPRARLKEVCASWPASAAGARWGLARTGSAPCRTASPTSWMSI